ncbi:hypothetical protein PMAYCL1PPCAC_26727, partial [Pristionchus mayeri]
MRFSLHHPHSIYLTGLCMSLSPRPIAWIFSQAVPASIISLTRKALRDYAHLTCVGGIVSTHHYCVNEGTVISHHDCDFHSPYLRQKGYCSYQRNRFHAPLLCQRGTVVSHHDGDIHHLTCINKGTIVTNGIDST